MSTCKVTYIRVTHSPVSSCAANVALEKRHPRFSFIIASYFTFIHGVHIKTQHRPRIHSTRTPTWGTCSYKHACVCLLKNKKQTQDSSDYLQMYITALWFGFGFVLFCFHIPHRDNVYKKVQRIQSWYLIVDNSTVSKVPPLDKRRW